MSLTVGNTSKADFTGGSKAPWGDSVERAKGLRDQAYRNRQQHVVVVVVKIPLVENSTYLQLWQMLQDERRSLRT